MFRRLGSLLAITSLLLLAACTSSGSDTSSADSASDTSSADSASDTSSAESDGTGEPEGSTRGITDTTVKIAYVGVDFGDLAKVGVAPDLGDQPKVVQAFVDEINANGGIGGRQIELRVEMFDGVAGQEVAQAACIKATQEFEPFAVLLGPVDPEVLRCVAGTNETLTVAMGYAEAGIAEPLEPRVWSSGVSPERELIGLANDLEHLGIDPDARIGIVTNPEDQGPIEEAFVPRLEELGFTVAKTVVLPCPDGAPVCEQHDTAAQQLKDAGADVVVVAVPALDNSSFLEAARNLNFKPQWVTYGDTTTATVTKFYEAAKDWFDGALGTTTVSPPDTGMSAEGEKCLATAAAAGANYGPGSDAAGYTAVLCINFQALVKAIEAAGDDPGDLDVARELGKLGELPPSSDVPAGSWRPDKHDARDHHWEVKYDGASGTWKFISDTPLEIDAG